MGRYTECQTLSHQNLKQFHYWSFNTSDILNLLFRDIFQKSLLRIYQKSGTLGVEWLQPQASRAKRQHDARETACQGIWKLLLGLPAAPGHGTSPASPCPCDAPAMPAFSSISIPVGRWPPGWTPSCQSVCCSWSPPLPLAPASFCVEAGFCSLLGVPGMAADRPKVKPSLKTAALFP